tara:strand:- start:106 stop:417 length:312 start_codon:yes stop_codon:yes gene_type:complete
MLLYHGTSIENAISIMKNGFDFSKSGKNWGCTYGNGIYFTPNYKTAKFYAQSDGIVLSFNIDVIEFQLTKYVSPNSRKKPKIPENYNCLVSPDKDEYLILYFI